MRVVKADFLPAYTGEEEAYGKLLLERRHPVLKEYLLREARIRKEICDILEAAPEASSVEARLREVKEEQQLIEAALNRYESI